MFAFVVLMITLLTVPTTVFQVFEEQDTRQEAATTIASADDPCAIDPDEEDIPEDTETDPPEDSEDIDEPDESNEETDPPSDENSDEPEDDDIPDETDDTPEEDVDSPRTRTPRVKDPERSYRKLAREIRKRVGAKKPAITVTVPTPNIRKPRKPEIPTPRPPGIRMPEFPDWFPFKEEKKDEDLGEQIRNKVRSNFEEEEEERDLGEEIRNKTRARFNNNPTPTSFFGNRNEKKEEQRRVIQVPRTKVPVVSQAVRPKSNTRKNSKLSVKDRLRNNKMFRVQQVEDCITPDPEQPVEEPLESPITITVTVEGLGGLTLIPNADVWFNSGDDGSCRTDGGGVCSKEVDHSGVYQISASKEGYETNSDNYLFVEGEDISASVTLTKTSEESSEEPNIAEMTFLVEFEDDGFTNTFSLEGATVYLDDGDAGSCTTDEAGTCFIEVDRSQSYLATVEADDFSTFEETVSFEPDQTETIIIMTHAGFTASILDYNTLLGCYSDTAPPKSCTDEQKKRVDFNRDGKVNSVDYNTFIYTFRL